LDKHFLEDKEYNNNQGKFNFKNAWKGSKNHAALFDGASFWVQQKVKTVMSEQYLRYIIEASGGQLESVKNKATHHVLSTFTARDKSTKACVVELDFLLVSVMKQRLEEEDFIYQQAK
jgi:hypothetical protein